MKTTKRIKQWKINGMRKASKYLSFTSFELFPSNRKAGIYISALIRQGLIENVGNTYFGDGIYEKTHKGIEFINQINA